MYVVLVDSLGTAVCMGIVLGGSPVPERTEPTFGILEKWLVKDNYDFSSRFTVETLDIDNYCYTNDVTKLKKLSEEKIQL